jgi:hypothetical protein
VRYLRAVNAQLRSEHARRTLTEALPPLPMPQRGADTPAAVSDALATAQQMAMFAASARVVDLRAAAVTATAPAPAVGPSQVLGAMAGSAAEMAARVHAAGQRLAAAAVAAAGGPRTFGESATSAPLVRSGDDDGHRDVVLTILRQDEAADVLVGRVRVPAGAVGAAGPGPLRARLEAEQLRALHSAFMV